MLFSMYYDGARALLMMRVHVFVVWLTFRAIKNGKGLHSKKEVPIHRVADISGVGIVFFQSRILTANFLILKKLKRLLKIIGTINKTISGAWS